MNILVDIGHPAHAHLFKNFILGMKSRKHKIVVTAKEMPIVTQLLDAFHIEYISIGRKGRSLLQKAASQVVFDIRVHRIAKKERINIALGTSVSVAHASRFLDMKSIIFNEDDAKTVPLFAKLTYPFADYIVTPDCLRNEDHGKKHIRHQSYHELAYLHPANFQPDRRVLEKLEVKEDERYFIVRFNAFKAHHDIGARGIGDKRALIDLLRNHGRVFISSESELDTPFQRYAISLPPEDMHSILCYALMFIGESQSMTMEAAVLGTPAIRCNTFVGRSSVIEELEHKFGLTYGFLPSQEEDMFCKIKELIEDPGLKDKWRNKLAHMLSEKIDLNRWMIDFVEKA